MEKLFVKKLDDGKEFKIMVRLIDNSVTVSFGTMCEYLGIDRAYWTKKLYHDLIRSTNREFIYLTTFQFRLQKIKPRSSDGRYWKKVILDLHPGEMLFYNIGKNQETEHLPPEIKKNSQEMDLKAEIESLKEIKDINNTEVQVLQGIINDKNKKIEYLRNTLANNDIHEKKINSQLTKSEEELNQVKFDLANANENIDFLESKNKELRKQQRKLNQALGIDLLNMAQSLLNMKEV